MPRRSGMGALKRPTSLPAGGGRHRERGETAVHPDEPAAVVGGVGRVAALGVEVGGLHVDARIPTGAVPADRGE
jgi:hypothetical protein